MAKQARLQSEFEMKDIVQEQFRDMAEAIVYLKSQLEYIAAGKAKEPRKYAQQAIAGTAHIFVPVRFIPLDGPK